KKGGQKKGGWKLTSCKAPEPPFVSRDMSKLPPALMALLLGLLLIAPGCSKRDASEAAPAAVGAAASPALAKADSPSPLAPVAASRAIRITVETAIVVDDVDRTIGALRESVERHHGRVAEGRATGSGSGRSASFDLRIPASEAAAFRADVARLG